MKIAYFTFANSSQNGTTRVLINYANYMTSIGHDVFIILPEKVLFPEGLNEKVKVLFPEYSNRILNVRGGFGIIDLLFKMSIVIKYKFDLMHCFGGHRPSIIIPSLVAKYFFKTKVIDEWWEWFGGDGIASIRKKTSLVGIYDTLLEIPTKKIFDGIICISSGLKSRLKHFKNQEVIVLNGAMDNANMEYLEIDEARSIIGLNNDYFIIGLINVGNNDHLDNLEFLLALEEMIVSNKNLRLFCTGNMHYIRNEMIPLLGDYIICNNWLDYDEYRKYLLACNCFALPYPKSKRNIGRWPNKIGDFIAAKRPIISNSVGDLTSIFHNYNIGFLCDNEKDQYKNAIKALLEGKVYNNFKKEDFDRVIMEKGIKARMERVVDFYKDISKTYN